MEIRLSNVDLGEVVAAVIEHYGDVLKNARIRIRRPLHRVRGQESQLRERIFLPFERLHPKDNQPGTGIGLAVAKMAVERMGGRIGVESAPGDGSRFWIELEAAS